MPQRLCRVLRVLIVATVTFNAFLTQAAAFELKKGDRISIIGNTLADRMQHHAWLETHLQAQFPEHQLSIRNLSFPGDELKTRPRSANFGSPDEWLSKTEADVVFCFFGYNEALRGPDQLDQFRNDLKETIDGMLAQKYNGESAPRLVFFSPIAHENLKSRHLPDGRENNKKLALYTSAMREVCAAKNVEFVDLFSATAKLYNSHSEPLTMNGIHLLDSGNRLLAGVILQSLLGVELSDDSARVSKIKQAVHDKNLHWFSRYRVVDGYNVYGGRSRLAWDGQSNFDVMQREMEVFDVKTRNRDKRIWAIAAGGDLKIDDSNIPPLLEVKTNRPGNNEDGSYTYLNGVEAMEKMKLAQGMQVNLFASEEMFPEVVNPVQMAVDTDGRLFVSVWPTYPHWNPTWEREDKIICLPDDNGDGVADRCVVFADDLNSITGFEFWGGGMLVAAPPEIWFLKDTNGDDKADFRLRVLQGVSSADTHHTANAMVIGPDGGLYWSRGVFHVTNMETPTKTFRSTSSGVYRFDPRTYEISFHFPIGPNPHGDVFDQWGYQFANDGTGGTGSYVNIGKGIGNKQWFKKRVRPVAATGILSSSHFPEANNGNFLICNTIGVLGVLQHEVKYQGADIFAQEIEPILLSSDPNFRPTDVEVGGDGALYISDWSNALIGHMQHNIRDPNRDHSHGRIYRVTYKGRELLKPVKLKGKPIPTVLDAFYAKENSVRYRARLELSGRDSDQVAQAVTNWASTRNVDNADDAQALLECLWVFEEHRIPNTALLKRVFNAKDSRVRAAAIRTLGHWGPAADGWEQVLIDASRDEAPLVRAEAVKAAVEFPGLLAAEAIFEVATLETDSELDAVLRYARGRIQIEQMVKDAIRQRKQLSPAARKYVLQNASVEDLLTLERTADVYTAILNRPNATISQLQTAISGIAPIANSTELSVLTDTIMLKDEQDQSEMIEALGALLTKKPAAELQQVAASLKKMVSTGTNSTTRQIGIAGWIIAEGNDSAAYEVAAKSKQGLNDYLNAIQHVGRDEMREQLYTRVASLVNQLPAHLAAEEEGSQLSEVGLQVDYFEPNPRDVALETLAKLKPQGTGVTKKITMDVPPLKRRDAFALRFSGMIKIDQPGDYRFSTTSDDGSRLYIGDENVVNNDGLHGMARKEGSIRLEAGLHPIFVTYFDNGGGDGLRVEWSGPGFSRREIPASVLQVAGKETLHDVAIRTLESIPGRTHEKFELLSATLLAGKHRNTAIPAMLSLPNDHWPAESIPALAKSLATYVSEIPARYRTSPSALQAMQLTDMLASRLPEAERRRYQAQLADLAVQVIRIGTVPHRMIYDKERLAIQAGKTVEFVFSNTDNMPHNFAVIKPGTLESVGMLAEKTAQEAGAQARHYIPATNDVLIGSRLLQPGQTQAISFEAPTEPGIYPFVCTYPGHWRRMYGALYVVADLPAYLNDTEAYLAANPLEMRDELLKYNARNTEWTYDDLLPSLAQMNHAAYGDAHHESSHQDDEHQAVGRSFEVGQSVFRAASCISCHKIGNEGKEFGPDLTKLDGKKRNVEHILRSMLEPEKEIEEKYQTFAFELDSGKSISGMVVAETAQSVSVIVDPLQNADPLVIPKAQIETRTKLAASTMPKGLLNRLSREEIIDLVAFVLAGGDPEHELFEEHDH